MQANKVFTGLLLGLVISLPQFVLAASFCTASPEGVIHMDDCAHNSLEECMRAAGSGGKCIANHDVVDAPYCVVTWETECTHKDYESCNKHAQQVKGFCYANPNYKGAEK